MQREFWIERWQQQQIGFHQSEINQYLQEYWQEVRQPYPESRVFVPLCGKSLDMLWLTQQGHDVIGIELSQIAIDDFIAENQLELATHHHPSMVEHRGEDLSLICGDFFDLEKDQLQDCHLVFDRASLIALPPEMRPSYAAHLTDILPADVEMLLITLAYNEDEMNGPPFSVEDSEVQQLFAKQFSIKKIAQYDILKENPKFQSRGCQRLIESVFILSRGRLGV